MLTRSAIVIVALLVASSSSNIDAAGTPDEITSNHLRGVIRQRRAKGSKGKGKNGKKNQSSNSKQSGGNNGNPNKAGGSAAFQDLMKTPILGQVSKWTPGSGVTELPNFTGGVGNANPPINKEDSMDSTDVGGSEDGAGDTDPNRTGDTDDCGSGNLPIESPCSASCQCSSGCCGYHMGVDAYVCGNCG